MVKRYMIKSNAGGNLDEKAKIVASRKSRTAEAEIVINFDLDCPSKTAACAAFYRYRKTEHLF
jgi:hypothetical protein